MDQKNQMDQIKQMDQKKRKQMLKKRLSIEGIIKAKKRLLWGARYASIKNCIFLYRRNQKDQKNRFIVDLRQCQVSVSQLDAATKQISVVGPDKASVDISFETEEVFQRWNRVFDEAVMGNDEFIFKCLKEE